MYASVGFGAISSGKVIARILEEYRKVNSEENFEDKLEELSKERVKHSKPSSVGIVVEGIDNCLVRLSKCCNPVPGDEIIGFITRGRGVSVHRADCKNLKDLFEDAESRNAYLGAFDGRALKVGSHVVYGTIVIRTSDYLTASQQKELTEKILNVLIAVDD